jgi:hypothetical protein
MHGIFKPFQVNFHVLPFKKNLQNTSHFVNLFLAHGDVVVGFAIFHVVLFQKRKKRKKEKKKDTPPWYVKVEGFRSIVNQKISYGSEQESQDLI